MCDFTRFSVHLNANSGVDVPFVVSQARHEHVADPDLALQPGALLQKLALNLNKRGRLLPRVIRFHCRHPIAQA